MKFLRRLSGSAWILPALACPTAWLWPAFVHRAPSFRDQGDFFYPLKLYTAACLRSGQVPLWNPFSGMGEPWLANLQAGVFYPPTALFLIPSAALAGGLFLLVHFALGACGTWRFLKEEAVSDAGAFLGAGLFAASGFAVSLSAFWNHFGAWAYLPSIAWLARSGLRTRSSRLGLAALVALQAMAGSPEISAMTLVVGFALILTARAPEALGWAEPTDRRRLLRLFAAAALGLAIAGWALMPFAELLMHSHRRGPLSPQERDGGAVQMAAAGSLLGLSQGSSGTSYLASLYVGPVAIAAALGALEEKQRRRLVLVIAGLGLVGLAAAMAAPPGTWLRALAPLDRIRYPAKTLALPFFGLALLAGFGLDALRFQSRRNLPVAATSLASLLVIAVANVSIEVRLVSAASAAALFLLAVARGQPVRRWLSVSTAVLIVTGLFLANRGLFRFADESALAWESSSVRFLAGIPGRILTPPMKDLAPWVLADARFDDETLRRQRESLQGYTNLSSGVRTVRTASAMPTDAADDVAASIDTASDVEKAAGPASARTLWTPFLPVGLGSRKVGEFFRAPLNPYRARLSVVSAYRVQPSAPEAWREIEDGRVDWRTTTVLNQNPDPKPPAHGSGTMTMASIVEDAPERLAARVYSSVPAILVLTDVDYPGWKAELDGRPVSILRADGYFRAVAMPAGDHRVVFRYRPLSVYAGAALTGAALILWAFLAWKGEPSRPGAAL